MMKNTKKGNYTVEAAIFLPIFIIAVLTIGFLVKVAGAGETVTHIATDEARRTSAEAYINKIALGFENRVEKRILSDVKDIAEVYVNKFKYLHGRNGGKGYISFNIDYFINVNLPLSFYEGFERKVKILCRGFVGATDNGVPMSFADMEKTDESRIVYVFPMAGKRYHGKSCTYVKSNPTKTILSREIEGHYKSCENCKPDRKQYGSIVYCFTKYGTAFHKGSCKTIKKYTVNMGKEQAEERGYTPCLKCGGE